MKVFPASLGFDRLTDRPTHHQTDMRVQSSYTQKTVTKIYNAVQTTGMIESQCKERDRIQLKSSFSNSCYLNSLLLDFPIEM